MIIDVISAILQNKQKKSHHYNQKTIQFLKFLNVYKLYCSYRVGTLSSPILITILTGFSLRGSQVLIFIILELEIKTLENAPRDADKLRRLLQVKLRKNEEAMHIKDIERLVTESLRGARL